MTHTKDEALRMALEALAIADNIALVGAAYTPKSIDLGLLKIRGARDAIKQTLAAQPSPVQEPVGWFKYDKVSGCWHPQHDEFAPTHAVREGWKQLCTTPPAQPAPVKPIKPSLWEQSRGITKGQP